MHTSPPPIASGSGDAKSTNYFILQTISAYKFSRKGNGAEKERYILSNPSYLV
jgi:hypothetical protein